MDPEEHSWFPREKTDSEEEPDSYEIQSSHRPSYDDPVIDMGRVRDPDRYRLLTGEEPRETVEW